MAITVLHTKVSTIPDDADTTLVRPSDWNATHSLSGVGTMAEQDANAVAITGGTINGTTLGATTPATVVATQVDVAAQGDLRLQDTTGGEYVAIQAPATLASSYTLTMPTDDGTAGQALVTDGSGVLSWSSAASGDVYGPASATDNAIARYDGTTGKIIQNSVVTIADTTGNMAGVGTLSSGAITSSSLTSGRVPYAGTAGLIRDAAALTFDGTILSATRFAGALNGTVGATTPSTVVATQVDITAQGDLRLQDTTGGQYVALQAPATIATSYTLTMPVDDGTAGQVLITDGSGVLSWSSTGSGDVAQADVGYAANQIPLNQYLGRLAYQDALSAADDGSQIFVGVTDVGIQANQVPLNQYLGNMAYQDKAGVKITGGTVSATMIPAQPTPTALTASATLTTAQIQTQIIQVTSATAVALTMPTGTVIDQAIVPIIDVNTSIDFYIINTGSASGAVTVSGATGSTLVGSGAVAINDSAFFRLRRTALNTYSLYRLA